jgi:hypothetical protein
MTDMSVPYKQRHDLFVKYIFDKKFAELRRGCDDLMSLKEGGNRTSYNADRNEATNYAQEASTLFAAEYSNV